MARFGFGLGFGIQGFAPIFGSESRNFTTLDPSGSKHYTIPTKTLSGDFSVKCNFTKGASDTMAIGGSSGNSNHFIAWVTTATALQIKIDGTTNAFVTADLNDGKYHEMEIVRTSGDVEVFIDGASIGTGPNNVTGDFVLGLIGGNNSPTNLWDGVIANFNINNLERFYKIDETWADDVVLKNSAVSLGSEEITNGDMNNGTTGWNTNNCTLAVVGGLLEVTSTGGSPSGRQSFTTVIGETYILSYTFKKGTAPNAQQFRLGTSAGSFDVFLDGSLVSDTSQTVLFTALSTTTHLAMGYGETATGQTSLWDNVSIKEAEGYGTAVNITSSDSENFNFDGSVSPNTWTNDAETIVIEVAGT